MIVGHTHRVSNLMRGHILITEGINAGTSYSVLQLMVQRRRRRVGRRRDARRQEPRRGRAADVKAIVDDANAQTAVLRNQVIGTQQIDITRDPTRLHESAMGNMVADAMRREVPGRRRRLHELRRPARRTCSVAPPSAGEQPCEITWGEVFAVLPFGNRTDDPDADRRPARGGVRQRVLAGLRPGSPAAPAASRRSRASRCSSTATAPTPVVDGMWKTPNGIGGPLTPIGPTDTVRLVTNDFMYTRRRRLHRLRRRARTCCSRATTCSRSRSTTSRPTRPSARVVEGRIVGP